MPRATRGREQREHRERRDEKRKVRQWETISFHGKTWENGGKSWEVPVKHEKNLETSLCSWWFLAKSSVFLGIFQSLNVWFELRCV